MGYLSGYRGLKLIVCVCGGELSSLAIWWGKLPGTATSRVLSLRPGGGRGSELVSCNHCHLRLHPNTSLCHVWMRPVPPLLLGYTLGGDTF